MKVCWILSNTFLASIICSFLLPSSIPLYTYTTVYFYCYPVAGHLGYFQYLAIMSKWPYFKPAKFKPSSPFCSLFPGQSIVELFGFPTCLYMAFGYIFPLWAFKGLECEHTLLCISLLHISSLMYLHINNIMPAPLLSPKQDKPISYLRRYFICNKNNK